MDLLPSILLNLEELDDLQFQFSSIPDLDQDTLPENTILLTPSFQNSSDNLTNKAMSSKGKQSSVTFDDIDVKNPFDQNKKRKLLHRNVERLRRQDMAKLYDSLRANLPTQSLEGKRSISDHMHEAMKYIQLMQKKIEELKKKRCKLNGISGPAGSPNGYEPDQCVTVKTCKEGMEVIVNSPMRGGLPLSRILNLLIDQGLTTIFCLSSKANDRLIHTIESEVTDGRSIDPTELQQHLRYLVSDF